MMLNMVTRPHSKPRNHWTLHTGGQSSSPARRTTDEATITTPLISKSAKATLAMYVLPVTISVV